MNPDKIKEPIFVIDTETTGLGYYPKDLLVEISIFKISTDLTVEHIYTSFIKHKEKYRSKIDTCWWSNTSGVKFIDTIYSEDEKTVFNKIKEILENKNALSWNTQYDFNQFIYPMMEEYGKFGFWQLVCPMNYSTRILKIDHYYGYKWPTLDEAAAYFKINLKGEFHRAKFDTHLTSLIVVELIKNHKFLEHLVK